MSLAHSSLRCEVTESITFTGPGPMPNTVRLPAAICVRPLGGGAGSQRELWQRLLLDHTHASRMLRAHKFSFFALASSSSSSCSVVHLSATFAWPVLSHCFSSVGLPDWSAL